MTYREKDYSISFIRFIAMSFIVVCHIFQYFDNYLCEWFNIGVQLFLCISGFLYGKKEKPKSVNVYLISRWLRIYIEYLIVVNIFIVLYFSFHPDYISPLLAAKMIVGYGTVNGGGHLWYIPTILLCSLLSLLYWDLFADKKSNNKIIVSFLVVTIIQVVVFETFFSFFNSAWINCYFCGFILGYLNKNRNLKLYRLFSSLIIIIAIISNAIQLYIDLLHGTDVFSGILLGCYHRFCNYAHLCLGVSLFVVFKYILTRNNVLNFVVRFHSFFDKSDMYSYEIYLVHQFFILGPFSLMKLTKYLTVNISIIVLLVISLAIVLSKMNNITQWMINKTNNA